MGAHARSNLARARGTVHETVREAVHETVHDELAPVFRALADSGRRALLDALAERDGQSVGELCEVLPGMTRFGVMKHLAVLADAHLVVTERVGRAKHHHLNPVPIREIHDRWISRFTEPVVAGLLDLRDRSEGA